VELVSSLSASYELIMDMSWPSVRTNRLLSSFLLISSLLTASNKERSCLDSQLRQYQTQVFTAKKIQVVVFRVVAPCSDVERYLMTPQNPTVSQPRRRRLESLSCIIANLRVFEIFLHRWKRSFHPENGDSTPLRNVGNLPHCYTGS